MTLNTFHLAGVAERRMTVGVPRFKELVDISRNIKTPRVTVAVRDGMSPHEAFHAIEQRKVQDVATSVSAGNYDSTSPGDSHHPPELFRVLLGDLLREKDAVVHVDLCCRRMMKAKLAPCDVARSLRGVTQHPCTWSSRYEHPWWVRIYCSQEEAPGLEVAVRGAVVRYGFTPDTCEIVPSSNGATFDMSDVLMQSMLADSEYLDTDTLCGNDVYAVQTCLGFEAAISVLEREITNTITADGTYVEQRHISLMVDTMTHRGYFMPFTRHGMGRSDGGALVRSTFEETCEVLRDASAFAEIDETNGVSQSIIMGKRATIGTGVSRVGKLHDSREAGGSEEGISSRIRTRVRKRKHMSTSALRALDEAEVDPHRVQGWARDDATIKKAPGLLPFSPPARRVDVPHEAPPLPALRRSIRRMS